MRSSFKTINPKFLFSLFLFLGFLPIVFISLVFFKKQTDLNYYEMRLESIESMLFLQAEKQKDNIALHRKQLNLDPNIEPTLSFLEKPLEKYALFKESEAFLSKPILVHSQDIIKILEHFDQGALTATQFIIKDFYLERVPSIEEEPLFKLNINLIKRDFT